MAQTALFIAGSAAGNLILNRLVSKGALKAVFGGVWRIIFRSFLR
jgi:hypothetical protein